MIANMLATTGFVVTNKALVRALGLECSALIGELCSEYLYWKERDKLEGDGWFFSTVENLEKETGIKRSTQTKHLNELKAMGLLDYGKKGMPARRYIRLDFKAIEEVMDGTKTPSQPNLGCPVNQISVDSQPDFGRKSTKNELTSQPNFGQYNNNNKKNKPRRINNNTNTTFFPPLSEIVELCEKQKLSGMSDNPKSFAEWFYSVVADDEGFMNYRGRKIKDWPSLVSMLRSIDVNGKAVKNAKITYRKRQDEDYF